VYDLEKLTFSFPDEQGFVHVQAPAGTFPPGSTILIINAMNGFVATLTADNDGAVGVLVEATLPATTSDRLMVTITDPQGNVTTFERSQFVNPETGETAVGPGGGTVKGPGGVELRLPPGAVQQGVRLKIALATEEEIGQAFTEEQLQKVLPGTNLGSVLKIESPDNPAFEKEVDVAFPLPDFTKSGGQQPTNPKDAYYYVHRKVESKDASGNPIVLFEVVDEAEVQGEGENARVVTASPPFPGFEGPLGGMLSMLLMSWSFDVQNPGKPLPGRIVGQVLRQRWDPTAASPVYDPLPWARVSATDAGGALVGAGRRTIAHRARQDVRAVGLTIHRRDDRGGGGVRRSDSGGGGLRVPGDGPLQAVPPRRAGQHHVPGGGPAPDAPDAGGEGVPGGGRPEEARRRDHGRGRRSGSGSGTTPLARCR
jgi:hypothetical protein